MRALARNELKQPYRPVGSPVRFRSVYFGKKLYYFPFSKKINNTLQPRDSCMFKETRISMTFISIIQDDTLSIPYANKIVI